MVDAHLDPEKEIDEHIDRKRDIIEMQDEKVRRAIIAMSDNNDVEEFKEVFKRKYEQDWDQIVIEFKDDAPDEDGVAAAEKFLEELFRLQREQMDKCEL